MKPNKDGKAIGLVEADGKVLERAETRLREAREVVRKLQNVTGEEADLLRDIESVLARCENCKLEFFGSKTDSTGLS